MIVVVHYSRHPRTGKDNLIGRVIMKDWSLGRKIYFPERGHEAVSPGVYEAEKTGENEKSTVGFYRVVRRYEKGQLIEKEVVDDLGGPHIRFLYVASDGGTRRFLEVSIWQDTWPGEAYRFADAEMLKQRAEQLKGRIPQRRVATFGGYWASLSVEITDTEIVLTDEDGVYTVPKTDILEIRGQVDENVRQDILGDDETWVSFSPKTVNGVKVPSSFRPRRNMPLSEYKAYIDAKVEDRRSTVLWEAEKANQRRAAMIAELQKAEAGLSELIIR